MDLKLPEINQHNKKKSNNYLSLEDAKPRKISAISPSTNASFVSNNNSFYNTNENNAITQGIKPYQDKFENITNEEIIKALLKRFSKLDPEVRHEFILKVFKDCDPNDMTYIYKTLPTLHRDFLSLLPKDISYEIIVYASPKDINTFAQVSKKWRELITHTELWEKLYDNIGLKSMYKVYLCKSITLNCVKLSLLTSWVKGKFHYSTIQAHATGILQICLYGDYLATAGADRTCKLYDIVSGSCLKVFSGHEKCILCVKMDSKKIITGSEDHTIRFWNIRTGEEIVKLNEHKGSVNSVAFYDTTLISGSSDNTIKIWKMEVIKSTIKKNTLLSKNNLEYNVTCLRTLFGHTASVQCVDILPTVCVSGSSDGTIRLWHVESGNCIKIIYPSLLKTIPIYKMCPELTKIEDISYEPISCIKMTYNYLVAGTYSGHIYLIDIYAKEITADDIFRPEWTNWKKKNLDIVNVESDESNNFVNYINTFNPQTTFSNKTKSNIIDDYVVPHNVLTIRGREFAYEELMDWVNTPANIKLNKIYNLDINAIPIMPEYNEEEELLNRNNNNSDSLNNDDQNNIKVNNVNKETNPNEKEPTKTDNNDDNNENKTSGENNQEDNDNTDDNSKDNNEMLNKANNLSMMDMSDFQIHSSNSNNLLSSNFDLKDDEDISAFERQISMNCDALYSKNNSMEDIEKPSKIPRKTSAFFNVINKPKTEDSMKYLSSDTKIPKKPLSTKKSIPINGRKKSNIRNSKNSSPKNKKKHSPKTNEKLNLDNFIFNEVEDDQKTSNENVNNNNDENITENNNDNKTSNNNISNNNDNNPDDNKNVSSEEKLNDTTESQSNITAKSNSKIEKYLNERYSNRKEPTLDIKKTNVNNGRRFKLEQSAARWILGVQVDAWRLVAGGCEGRSIFWNHKIGTPIFEINKETTNIITIPSLHAKKRKRKVKGKYQKTNTIENHTNNTRVISNSTRNNGNDSNNNINNNNENNYENNINENNEEFNEQNDNDRNVIDADKIHSFVYTPGKDQPITDVIFNERFLIISDIKGKLRVWEVEDFV